jgi:hypothetical protein
LITRDSEVINVVDRRSVNRQAPFSSGFFA